MKKFIFILIYLSSLACSAVTHEEFSLEGIISSIKEIGVANTLTTIEKDQFFDRKSRQIVLSDKVEILSTNQFKKVKWTASQLSENGKEFTLSIPVGGYSLVSPFTGSKFKILLCEDNGLSSGKKIVSFDNNSLVVVESWSCGSLGCSYDFLFSKNTTETNQHFCQ